MPYSLPGLDAPQRLAELLHPGQPWPLPDALRLAHGLALRVEVLHQQRQTHRAITAEAVVVDPQFRPTLSAPPETRRFDPNDYDPETCPPELAGGEAVELAADIEAAAAVLQQAGCPLDPRRIDVYQLGALLCRLLSGDSVRAYMFSPVTKAKVPEPARPLLDRALGHDGGEPLADCGPWITALAEALQRAGSAPAAATGQDTPAHGNHVGLADDTPAHGSLPAPPPGGRPQTGADLPFQRLGNYAIVARIGCGGMGDVYKGYEQSLDRYVAIKVLPPALARDEEFVHRFRAEATAAAKVAHPNIVPIYSIGEEAGHHFFAMQFIEGEPLSARLQRQRRLPVEEALKIVEQCLAGLEAAHARGLIHRDIKPGNVLLEQPSGRAVLVDFGLVRMMGKSTQMTATGVIMGTVDYIAPEQARGQKVDGRTDLYSVGVLLYQLLSGRLPFEADTPTAMIFQHAYEPPLPLCQAAPDVPATLEAIVDKLLRKDPSERYASARAVLDDLVAFQEGRPVAAQGSQAGRGVPSPTAAFPPSGAAGEAGLPSGLEGLVEETPLGQLRDWAATLFRRHAPQFAKDLQTTTQQIDGAVAQYQRRHKRQARLLDEARNIAAALSEQLEANRRAAAEAEQAAGSAATEEARRTAERQRDECEENAAALQSQLDAQQAQIDEIELELNKVDARLAQLRSQRDLLAARLKAAEAQQAMEPGVRRPSPPRWMMVAAVFGCTVLGAAMVLVLARLVPRGIVAPVPEPGTFAPPLAVAPFDAAKAREHQEQWANYLRVPVVGTNSIGMKLVLIPPGEFSMGSSAAEIARCVAEARQRDRSAWHAYQFPREAPIHKVRLGKAFYLGICEVTQAEYERVMGNNPSHFKGVGNRPVETVTWHDATEFCRRLGALPGEKATGAVYRLPTEAEWEYACRAGTTGRYSFGEDASGLEDYAWWERNAQGRTHPVGRLRPNAWGLFDMHGNVAEWCADWYGKDYYARSPATDPAGPDSGGSRVLRGDSWYYQYPLRFRSAFRDAFGTQDSRSHFGFRVAITLSPGSTGLGPVPSPPETTGAQRTVKPVALAENWTDLLPLVDADRDRVAGQ